MPNKRIPLVAGEFYHVYNRGIAHQPIFFDQKSYEQGFLALSYYRFVNPPVRLSRLKELSTEEREKTWENLQRQNDTHVRIVSYVFMPNHFHFLLQQSTKNGITNFVSQFSNSFTKYINTKRQRVGPLLQGIFKAVRIETDEQLLHLSRYIHLNPLVSYVVNQADFLSYPWSSLPDYLNGKSKVFWMDTILSNFYSKEKYKQFVLDQEDYGKKLEQIKHLLLE